MESVLELLQILSLKSKCKTFLKSFLRLALQHPLLENYLRLDKNSQHTCPSCKCFLWLQ